MTQEIDLRSAARRSELSDAPGSIPEAIMASRSSMVGKTMVLVSRVLPSCSDGWANLVAKVTQLNMSLTSWPAEAVQSIKAPTLVVIGDSDIVRPEHAVEIFRLLGGGVAGDMAGLPNSQLAILPGTTHVSIVDRADLLLPMVVAFLDRPKEES